MNTQTEVKHTLGPWDYEEYWDKWFRIPLIADIYGDTEEEAEANARLIAACPELLAAAKMVIESYGYDQTVSKGEMHLLDMVVAKAEGR